MAKILIIGSSYSIKNTFAKKYINDDIFYLNFRDVWKKREIDKYDLIILSGFHRSITHIKLFEIKYYIEEYQNFVDFLSKRTNKIIFISTFIPQKISFSRIVYFYQNINKILISYDKLIILSFKKINDDKFKRSLSGKIINFFSFKVTSQDDLIKNTKNYILKKLNHPRILFIKVPRSIFIERLLRLLDVN